MSDDSPGRLCPICDNRGPAGAAFCINCGARLGQQTVSLRAADADGMVISLTVPDADRPAAAPAYPPAAPSYQQPAYPPQPYQQPGYPQPYQQPGYPQPTYPPQPYQAQQSAGFALPPYQQPGYPQPYQQPGSFTLPPAQQPGYPQQPQQPPAYTAQQGYGQQINIVVTTTAESKHEPLPQPTLPRVVTIAPRKSVGLAFVLAFFFGPLALFYVQSSGKAVAHLLITLGLGLITAGLWLIFYYFVCLLLVPVLASQHNRRTVVIR